MASLFVPAKLISYSTEQYKEILFSEAVQETEVCLYLFNINLVIARLVCPILAQMIEICLGKVRCRRRTRVDMSTQDRKNNQTGTELRFN